MKRPTIEGTLREICLDEARKSPCQKRGFGAILMLNGSIIGVDHNRPLDETKHLCDPECIRFQIPSGTDSMIGACGHAEERLIWDALREGRDLKDAEIYVSGIEADGTPYWKSNAYFYCIRCATAMAYAGVRGVHVWVDWEKEDGGMWYFIETAKAVKSSLEFALGQRKA